MAPVVVRRLTQDDRAPLTALVDRARDAGELLGSSSPHGEWLVEMAMHQPEVVAVAVADGALAGAVMPEPKVLVVEPAWRRRGVGRSLVGAGLEIERERGRPNLLLGVLPDDADGIAFLRATGFAYHSTLWDLDLAPEAAANEPSWPPGCMVRTFDRTRDLDAWVTLFNAAFADHATPLQLDASLISADWERSPFRDEDLLLVFEGDGGDTSGPVGFCATEPGRPPEGGVGARGEIWTIGVRPDRQGMGLGRQLLRWGVGHLRSIGVQTVTLSVNGRNPRAIGLYESEGFTRTSTRERWALPVTDGQER